MKRIPAFGAVGRVRLYKKDIYQGVQAATDIMAADIAQQQQSSDPRDSSGWPASLYNQNAPFVYSSAFISPVLDLLAAQPGERIIDFGCGSGEITLELKKVAEQGDGGLVVGVDFSESMVGGKIRGSPHSTIDPTRLPKPKPTASSMLFYQISRR